MLLKPGEENQEYWFMFPGFDKCIHLSIFAFLGFIFLNAFPKTAFITYMQIMLSYAFLTEILQDAMHMGRAMEVGDVVADAIGVIIASYIYKVFFKIFKKYTGTLYMEK